MQSFDDKSALIFFLLGAERENLMLQGRTATAALEAAARLLGYPPAALEELRALVR